jgi:hypothetical protein
MANPVLGRNARLYLNGVAIAFGKNITIEAIAETIREYSMDSQDPAITAPGPRKYGFTIERLYIDGTYVQMWLDADVFDLIFQPSGTYMTEPYEEWTGCVFTKVGKKMGETGGLIEVLQGEITSITVNDTP